MKLPHKHEHEVSVLSYTHFTLEERKYLQQLLDQKGTLFAENCNNIGAQPFFC